MSPRTGAANLLPPSRPTHEHRPLPISATDRRRPAPAAKAPRSQ